MKQNYLLAQNFINNIFYFKIIPIDPVPPPPPKKKYKLSHRKSSDTNGKCHCYWKLANVNINHPLRRPNVAPDFRWNIWQIEKLKFHKTEKK